MAELDSSPRPSWMDDDFLKTCIRNSNNLPRDTPIQIDGVVLKFAVPKGENFMSLMYRISVEYRMMDGDGKVSSDAKKESFVCKVSHDNPELATMTISFFVRETEMYLRVVPDMQKLVQDKDMKTEFICRCLNRISEGCPRVLALEDLVVQGYTLADRHKGLDLKHIKVVLYKLATFHAASKIAYELMSDEEKKQIFESPMVEAHNNKPKSESGKESGFSENLMKTALTISSELSKYGDKYNTAIIFMKKYVEIIKDVSLNMAPIIPDNQFNVICHSDLHLNNMMFKYAEDGSVEDVMFVDLQLSHYNSVAFDFHYFFASSSDMEVRKNHFDEVKKFYLDSFNSTLTQLGYEGDLPTEEEFDEELKRCILIGVLAMTAILPIIITKFDSKTKSREESNSFSIEQIAGLMDKTKDSRFLDIVRNTIDVLQERGFFDKFPEILQKERGMGV